MDTKNSSNESGMQTILQGETVEVPSSASSLPTSVQTQPNLASSAANPQVLQPQISNNPTQKKSSCFLWCVGIAVILGLIVICCICSTVFLLPQMLKSTNTSQDFNKNEYTTIDPNTSTSNAANTTLDQKIDEAIKQNPGKPFTITLTEEEALNSFRGNSPSMGLEGVFIKFEDNNQINIRAELSKILENSNTENSFNPNDFKDIYIGVDAKIATDGKSVDIIKVSSGNPIVDSFLGSGFAESIEQEINNELRQSNRSNDNKSDHKIDKIEIKKGLMTLTFVPVTL